MNRPSDLFGHGKFIQFTDDQLRRMVTMYLDGNSCYRLAKIFGINPCAITKRLRMMGVKIRPRGRRNLYSDQECAAMYAHKVRDSLTIQAMAKYYSIGARTVVDIIGRARALS